MFNWFKKKVKNVVVAKAKLEKFPCRESDCLVQAACTKACDKLEMDDDKLKELFLKYNACPDCGCETFMEGPSGGMATNVKCNGCGHWFNFGLPLFIQRIHIDKSTGRFYD
jgi:ribosomal protein S27E